MSVEHPVCLYVHYTDSQGMYPSNLSKTSRLSVSLVTDGTFRVSCRIPIFFFKLWGKKAKENNKKTKKNRAHRRKWEFCARESLHPPAHNTQESTQAATQGRDRVSNRIRREATE